MKTLNTKQKLIDNISLPDPDYGDIKLNVFPIIHDGSYIKLPIDGSDFKF